MSSKTSVHYTIEKNWDDKWQFRISSAFKYESAEEALHAARAMYALEDTEQIQVNLSVSGAEAVDIILKGA